MLADLKGRGVERMWHLAGPGVGHLGERASAAFPGTTVGAAVDGLVTGALAPSRRHGLPSPGRVAEHVREGLLRAIRQRRSFESESAGLDFLAGALQRMERRMDRGGLMATMRSRLDPGALMVPRL